MRDLLCDALRTVALLVGIALMFALTRFAVQATEDVHQTAQALQKTVGEAQATLAEVKTSAKAVGEKTLPVLNEAHDAVRQSRALVDVALKVELANRNTIQNNGDALYRVLADAETLLWNANTESQLITNHTLEVMDQAKQTLGESSKAMDAAAGLLSHPSLHLTLAHLDETSANAALMSADAQKKFHLLLFPPKQPWWKRTMNFAATAGQLTFDALTLK